VFGLIAATVTGSRPADFACPKCKAPYKVVRLPSDDSDHPPDVSCPACGMYFPAKDGSNILKYFLVPSKRPKRK
jgi:transcription elongation factor Elf1